MKQMKKRKDAKIDISWTGYSNKDKEEIKVSSDMSFIDHLMLNKSVRNRIIAIIVIALFLILI